MAHLYRNMLQMLLSYLYFFNTVNLVGLINGVLLFKKAGNGQL
jgi:hypothetical protein